MSDHTTTLPQWSGGKARGLISVAHGADIMGTPDGAVVIETDDAFESTTVYLTREEAIALADDLRATATGNA